jgi:hypothetical protein
MNCTNSRYKFFGGFGLLLFLNLLAGTLTSLLFTADKNVFSKEAWQVEGGIIAMSVILILQSIMTGLFTTQCKFIRIDTEGITFINPLLPFLRLKKKWTEYDYFVTTMESSRGGTYEAVWLVKDNRISNRISSYYYSNYNELKRSILLPEEENLKSNPIKQLANLFGVKIK